MLLMCLPLVIYSAGVQMLLDSLQAPGQVRSRARDPSRDAAVDDDTKGGA
jgi:hypothetical protein